MNSGTTPTRQVPVVQPLQVNETFVARVSAHIAPPSDNPDRIVGLH
jgi:hypothetical protein